MVVRPRFIEQTSTASETLTSKTISKKIQQASNFSGVGAFKVSHFIYEHPSPRNLLFGSPDKQMIWLPSLIPHTFKNRLVSSVSVCSNYFAPYLFLASPPSTCLCPSGNDRNDHESMPT